MFHKQEKLDYFCYAGMEDQIWLSCSCQYLTDAIYPDVLFWPVLEQRWDMATVMNGDEQTPETQTKKDLYEQRH